jgi:hypothetical protein
MPDVEITNPTVQIDLSAGSSTTVPAGEQWKVSLIHQPGSGVLRINGEDVIDGANTQKAAHIRTDLFDGDTIKAQNGSARIRGYRVD